MCDEYDKQPSVAERVYHCDGISVAVTTGWVASILEPQHNERGKR